MLTQYIGYNFKVFFRRNFQRGNQIKVEYVNDLKPKIGIACQLADDFGIIPTNGFVQRCLTIYILDRACYIVEKKIGNFRHDEI